MSTSLAMRIAWPLGLLVVGLVVVHGLANLAGAGSFDDDTDRTIYGAMQVIAAALIALGLAVSVRTRWGGIGLVASGVVVISAAMPWFVVFTVPVGIGLVALANSKHRSGSGPERPSESAPTTN